VNRQQLLALGPTHQVDDRYNVARVRHHDHLTSAQLEALDVDTSIGKLQTQIVALLVTTGPVLGLAEDNLSRVGSRDMPPHHLVLEPTPRTYHDELALDGDFAQRLAALWTGKHRIRHASIMPSLETFGEGRIYGSTALQFVVVS
jgi:hypothetical protein